MAAPGACQLVLVATQKFIHPGAGWDKGACTKLSPQDASIVGTAMGRAWGFVGTRIMSGTLEAALTATVEDLPFLAGRWGCRRCHSASAADSPGSCQCPLAGVSAAKTLLFTLLQAGGHAGHAPGQPRD